MNTMFCVLTTETCFGPALSYIIQERVSLPLLGFQAASVKAKAN